ncbi:hypothetical protein WA026_001288 [Henosepilachna vigintioctopunctata]|uniref:Uncharacterized protein n=1 Tax=Henosepilachna vigintioctopunctata TaxID=420089 RepID=A0AAW1UQQ8_9CUCU
MNYLVYITLAITLVICSAAPVDQRKGRDLYYEYVPNNDYEYDTLELADSENYVDDGISRAIPFQRRKNGLHKMQPANAFNSPIYYIALPPQPYIFVPGMGYMSQPPPHPASEFLNLPVNFLANGKPSNIYQWSSGPFSNSAPQERPTTPRPIKKPKPDSSIINLDDKFVFNGKPGNTISILRDSYNALYSDALQNFYP